MLISILLRIFLGIKMLCSVLLRTFLGIEILCSRKTRFIDELGLKEIKSVFSHKKHDAYQTNIFIHKMYSEIDNKCRGVLPFG